MGRARTFESLALASGIAFAACTGEITDPGGLSPTSSAPLCTSTASPGAPVPMRRLTAAQVERTVDDVLGVKATPDVPDEKLFTFKSNISSSVDFSSARAYLDFAEAVVETADLSACSATGAECDAWLFDEVGMRLFRRPLYDDERTRYDALFEKGLAEGGPSEGARWVVEGMLQSPSFLYLDEVVGTDGYLDDWSMAARLSLTIWGTNPDHELLDKAAQGLLSSPEQIVAEADRLLADPRSVGGLTDFVDQWFRLERLDDADARPDLQALGDDTIAAMRREPVEFLANLIESGGDLDSLLASSTTAAHPELVSIYQDDLLEQSSSQFILDPARRAGILSLPGVMAALAHAGSTAPTLRGYAVLANFLCDPPNPPPAGVNITLPDIGEGKTTRERLEAHFSDPACANCHQSMDGMGFAFEGIDWLGQTRTEEFGKPIDDSTTFSLDDAEVTVEGPRGLANVLSESAAVATCVARQWVSYGAGMPDQDESACLVQRISERIQEPNGLHDMVRELVKSDWYRRGPGEQK